MACRAISFTPSAEECSNRIIGYRFVVWLNNEDVAVGFNTSPYCRSAPDRKIEGSARILLYDAHGTLKASRDLPYLADGNGEVVAQGEARRGPKNSLLFRIESVNLDSEGRNESPSAVLILDENLKAMARIERFLEQTTFANNALVFQEGYTLTGPRSYVVMDGAPPSEAERWIQNWPTGTLDRKFGEHSIAFMLCQQELQPNQYSSSNIIVANAKKRCTMNLIAKHQSAWTVSLQDGETAALIGILANGSVAGEVSSPGSPSGRLVIWKRDGSTEAVPWIPMEYRGTIQTATADLTRYLIFATNDDEQCFMEDKGCSPNGRLFIFDRESKTPMVSRPFPKNGRAALAPDGLHYATFESGKLCIYALPYRVPHL